MKKESFELGFEVRQGGEIPQAGRQRIPDSWDNETERTVANRSEIAFRDFQESDTRKEKLKGRREVYRRSDGRQELWSCIRSGISQATNGVHLTEALHGLAFLSSERVPLHCSEPSAIDLSVPQALIRVAIMKAGGNQIGD